MHDGMGATGDIQVWLRDRKVFSSQKGRGVGAGGGVGGREERRKGPWKNYRFSGKNRDFSLGGSGFRCWLPFCNHVILSKLLSLSKSRHPDSDEWLLGGVAG